MIVLAASAMACNRSHEAPEAKPAAAAGTPAKVATAASSCDAYVRMVTSCIETKTPESNRAEERADLDSYQKSLKAFSIRPALMEGHCANSMTRIMRQDDYGCYGDEAVKRGVQTACTILTRAELEGLVHTGLEDGRPGNQKCSYVFAANQFAPPLEITVHWKDGQDEVAAARGAKALLGGRLDKQFGKGSPLAGLISGEDVEGVGDEAYFTMAAIHPMLVARLGDVAVGVEGVDQEALVAIAKLALPRITPDPGRRP